MYVPDVPAYVLGDQAVGSRGMWLVGALSKYAIDNNLSAADSGVN